MLQKNNKILLNNPLIEKTLILNNSINTNKLSYDLQQYYYNYIVYCPHQENNLYIFKFNKLIKIISEFKFNDNQYIIFYLLKNYVKFKVNISKHFYITKFLIKSNNSLHDVFVFSN